MDRDELEYAAALTTVNTELGHYIVRFIDAAHGIEPLEPQHSLAELETHLADRLQELVGLLRSRGADGGEHPHRPLASPAPGAGGGRLAGGGDSRRRAEVEPRIRG